RTRYPSQTGRSDFIHALAAAFSCVSWGVESACAGHGGKITPMPFFWGCYLPQLTGIQKCGAPKFTPYKVETGECACVDHR
ncbi:MAG: hypothetical protein VW349_12575, partial [Gammaproteobacteria bacterium]